MTATSSSRRSGSCRSSHRRTYWSTTPGLTRVERITDSDPAGWDLMWRVNLRAPMRLAQAVLPGMLERGWGRMVFVATDSARAGAGGEGIYSATKAGLLGFAKTLARESARDGVTSNVVCPGLVDTAMLQAVAAEKPEVIESLSRGHSDAPTRHRRRDRGGDRLPLLPRSVLHHRADDQRQRWHHDDVTLADCTAIGLTGLAVPPSMPGVRRRTGTSPRPAGERSGQLLQPEHLDQVDAGPPQREQVHVLVDRPGEDARRDPVRRPRRCRLPIATTSRSTSQRAPSYVRPGCWS